MNQTLPTRTSQQLQRRTATNSRSTIATAHPVMSKEQHMRILGLKPELGSGRSPGALPGTTTTKETGEVSTRQRNSYLRCFGNNASGGRSMVPFNSATMSMTASYEK